MRTFGFALATVLCAIQLTVALPRPDFGIAIDVFSADKTGAVALAANVQLGELWNDDPVSLVAGYDILTTVLGQINIIGNDFATKVQAIFDALSALAAADSDVTGSFGAVTAAIVAVQQDFAATLAASIAAIDAALPDNQINIMLDDATGEVLDTLLLLDSTLGVLKAKVADAVAQAGGEAVVTKAILRSTVTPLMTSVLTTTVEDLKADLPLVFFILMKTKDLLKMADDYIIEASDVAAAAVQYIDDGLAALVAEVDSYTQSTTDYTDILDAASAPQFVYAGLDLTVVPDVQEEAGHTMNTFNTELTNTVGNIVSNFNYYKQAIPAVSTGYTNFFAHDACDHIYDIVTILINHGPYAEYCFHKYADEALALFDQNARQANECVDREITRLLKLQEVLVSIAEQIVFSVEDLLETVTVCVANANECNTREIGNNLMNIHLAIEDKHYYVMAYLVDAETYAGLARLQACVAANRYDMLRVIADMQTEFGACEVDGPNA